MFFSTPSAIGSLLRDIYSCHRLQWCVYGSIVALGDTLPSAIDNLGPMVYAFIYLCCCHSTKFALDHLLDVIIYIKEITKV